LIAATWLGHATVLLELDGARLVTDPLLGDHVGPLVRTAAPIAPGVLDHLDAVLLSHLHADHADLPSLRRLARDATVVAPRGSGRWLAGRGVRNVRELGVGEDVRIGPVRVAATRATHDGRRRPVFGGARADALGYVVSGTSSAYFAGDTDLFDEMAGLAGSIDLALLPVSGWGATLGPGHLDAVRAAEAAARIVPRVAVPIHWGTLTPRWPLRRHPDPGAPPREFAAGVARDTPSVEVRVLEPGERTVVD
jgi:L-ascorbate metabolism protein UlaG (beta-lactamase superfamily)